MRRHAHGNATLRPHQCRRDCRGGGENQGQGTGPEVRHQAVEVGRKGLHPGSHIVERGGQQQQRLVLRIAPLEADYLFERGFGRRVGAKAVEGFGGKRHHATTENRCCCSFDVVQVHGYSKRLDMGVPSAAVTVAPSAAT